MTTWKKKVWIDWQEIEILCWKVWTLHAGPNVFMSIEYTRCQDVILFN